MNRQKLACLGFVLSIFAILSVTRVAAQDGLPKGWFRSGAKPANYEMSIDETVKHGGKASAALKFAAAKADGFATLMQVFGAESWRGKRLRMSAWVKTETADDRAQLWLRLDAPKRGPGFDNMGNRPIKGVSDWRKYELVLDIAEDVSTINFGVMSFGTGRVWVDDFTFEAVGADVPVTDMLTEAQRKEVRSFDETPGLKFPAQPTNLDFESGATPVRKFVAVSAKVLDEIAGYYSLPEALGVVRRVGDKLMLVGGSQPGELQALSESEFVIASEGTTFKVVRDANSRVVALQIELPNNVKAPPFKKLDVAAAQARGEKLMAEAYAARGGLAKLKQLRNVWHDGVRYAQGQNTGTFELYLSDAVEFYQENRDTEGKGVIGKIVMNGKTRWIWNNDGSATTEADAAQYASSKWNMQLMWLELTLMPLAGATLEAFALDDATYQGKAVNVVGAFIDDHSYTLMFDATTHHLMRITTNSANGRLDYAYDDYREVKGVQLAHKAVITSGGAARTVTISKFKLNGGIEAAKLNKP